MSDLPPTNVNEVKWRTMPGAALGDMSQHVVQQIVDNAVSSSLENIRECSAWMQDVVDGSFGYHEKLNISICSNMVELQLDPTIHKHGELNIKICNKEGGSTIIHSKLPPKYVNGVNYLVAGAQEFGKIFFRHPKTHVEEVHMDFAPWRPGNRLDDTSLAPFVQTLQKFVQEKNQLFSVEKLNLNIEKNEGCVGSLLPLFKPKVLKSLFVQTDNTLSNSIPIETVIFLNQWKNLEFLMIRGWPLNDVRFEWFMHIPTLWLEIESLTVAFTMLAVEKFRAGHSSKYTVYFEHRGHGVAEYLNGTLELVKRNIWSVTALNGSFNVELKEDRLLFYYNTAA